jgi:hypothetical protein
MGAPFRYGAFVPKRVGARMAIIFLTFLAGFGHASVTYSQNRKALVIGNERYESVASVPKAEADARGVAESLELHGFHPVTLLIDLKQPAMSRAIEEFISSIGTNDLAVFYFAGNGVAINAQNFLLPVDVPAARAKEESRVLEVTIALNSVIARIQGRGAKLVSFIDASRDNPFDLPGVRPLDIGTGLARMSQLPAMTSALFAASPGEKAYSRVDSKDTTPYSIFGRAVLAQLSETDVSMGEFAANVQSRVRELAQHYALRQTPIFYSNGIGDSVYLSGRLPSPRVYLDNVKLRSKPDGSKRFRLSEIAAMENELPGKDECATLGQQFGDQLRREGGESARFWVSIRRGDIGYCQRVDNRWYVEYFDRDIQDALVLEFKK